jgi:hypothetical protein
MKTDWRKAFAIYLVFLLTGYALLDKAFAYIGIGFIYVSEIGLLVGVLVFFIAWIQGNLDLKFLKQISIAILAAFLIWSLARTLPYIHQYKLFAIRDALLWGYAAFAFFILLLIRPEWLERFFKWYGYAIPFFLVWWLLAFFLNWFTNIKWNPFNPAFPIFQLKTGDVAVHLSGMAAYMLLNIGERTGIKRAAWIMWLIWLIWWMDWLVYGVSSRAAMLGPLLILFILLLLTLRPIKKWGAPIITGIIMVALLFLSNVHLKIPDPTRKVEISSNQIVINFASLLGSSGNNLLKPLSIASIPVTPTNPSNQDIPTGTEINEPSILRTETIGWRLDWWKKIVGYTVTGPFFWSGKGYGINLADDDGFQVMPDHSLRSPHNVFMTILARSGIPGLVLWCAFIMSVIYLLLKNALKKDQSNKKVYAIWLLVYILASLFNGSFDVYLEGPMGGIWFWSLIGMVFLYTLRTGKSSERMQLN